MNRGSDPVSRARFLEPAREAKPGEKLTDGVPLAKLIKRELNDKPEIVMLSKSRSLAAEKFRRLKTTLANEEGGGPQVIIVTSTAPSEGKSLVATNLALAFAADTQDDVLLVDADLRRPTIGHWVSPPPDLGLTEVLETRTELEHTVLELKNSSLKVLPAGTPPRDPIVLLSSAAARDLFADLRKKYKRIIIDTPPVMPFADADALTMLCDGLLMVARAGSTRGALFRQAIQSITSTRVLGVILNDATFSLADRGNYAAYDKNYYDYYAKDGEK
jgi:receptor protein-tyrosine kinase/non-specific protein-tyrosine kinase